jgi:predicted transcriptional regulator
MDTSLRPSKTLHPSQIRMARSGLDLTVRELAVLCDVNKATIVRIEAGYPVRESTMEAVQSVLEDKGVQFSSCSVSDYTYVGIKVI